MKQQTSEFFDSVGRRSCERIIEEKLPRRTSYLLSDALKSRPQLRSVIKFKHNEITLSQNYATQEGAVSHIIRYF